MSNSAKQAAYEAILRWQYDAGVDEAIADQVADRTQDMPNPGAIAAPDPDTAPRSPTSGIDAPVADAPTLLQGVETVDGVAAALEQFEGCALKRTATRLCMSDGNPEARLMLIGEGPGRDEDLQGKPFVGRAGQLLDRMLAAIGHDRSSTYITNTVFWRPPGNRNPTPEEMAQCQPFLQRQVEIVRPDALLLLGAVSAQSLTGRKEGITRLRGRWFDVEFGELTIPALATLHPAYLLRQPGQKKYAWRDLLALESRLAELKKSEG